MIDIIINPQRFITKAFRAGRKVNFEIQPHIIPVKRTPKAAIIEFSLNPKSRILPRAIITEENKAGIIPPKTAAMTMTKCRKSAMIVALILILNNIKIFPSIPYPILQYSFVDKGEEIFNGLFLNNCPMIVNEENNSVAFNTKSLSINCVLQVRI
jgi:hypothetical protein